MTDQLDRICKRQTARTLARLRKSGHLTHEVETEILRFARFAFQDIKAAIYGHSTGADNHEQATKGL
jgi:hypothetical protein